MSCSGGGEAAGEMTEHGGGEYSRAKIKYCTSSGLCKKSEVLYTYASVPDDDEASGRVLQPDRVGLRFITGIHNSNANEVNHGASSMASRLSNAVGGA